MNKYIDTIKKTTFLSEDTKKLYLKRINTILKDFYNSEKSLEDIIKNPEEFSRKLTLYIDKNRLSHHTKHAYCSAILTIFHHDNKLKEENPELFKKWIDLEKEIVKPINDQYNSNEPNEKQKSAYLPFEEIVKIRNSLIQGSVERLLISMYIDIPPLRSDYYKTMIFEQEPDDDKDIEDNYIVLNSKDNKTYMMLKKYKTFKNYGVLKIDINDNLKDEILNSYRFRPRRYLFINNNGKPFDKKRSFNKWANRILKKVFKKNHFTLSMFRHIYLTRPELELEKKSNLEKDILAKAMGHSIGLQSKYSWHKWIEKK